jgi:hypothetical protein
MCLFIRIYLRSIRCMSMRDDKQRLERKSKHMVLGYLNRFFTEVYKFAFYTWHVFSSYLYHKTSTDVEQINIPVEILPDQLKNIITHFKCPSCIFNVEKIWRRRRRRHIHPKIQAKPSHILEKNHIHNHKHENLKSSFQFLFDSICNAVTTSSDKKETYLNWVSVLYITNPCHRLHRDVLVLLVQLFLL